MGIKHEQTNPNLNWVCIQDPTGDFTGGQIPYAQIVITASMGFFTAGTQFENKHTAQILLITPDGISVKREKRNATKNNL